MAKPVLIRRNTDQGAMRNALSHAPSEILPAVTKNAHLRDTNSEVVEPYVVGQTYDVPLFRLQKSENNARVFYTAEELDSMTISLQANGQDVPAIGYEKAGRVVIVDGQKRFQSATSGGLPTLKVSFIATPESAREEYLASRRINSDRSTQGAFDDAIRWQALLASGVFANQEELAKDVGLSVPSISKVIKLNRIPERLMRSMNDDQQTRAASIAYEISQIFGSDSFKDNPDLTTAFAEDVIRQTKERQLSRDQVTALIKDREKAPKTRTRAESEVVRFGDSKGTLKVFVARGQLDLSFTGLPEARVGELRQRIQAMLDRQLAI
jgi:ParB family transcriptional regulator, chromosome partitioning protein